MQTNEDMELFTTGQVAEACNVSVRTVQYYDEKGLLHPTTRSEGGRRLYDQAALEKMQRICLLKGLGLKLAGIRGVLESEGDAELLCLLREQERELTAEAVKSEEVLQAVRQTIARIQGEDAVEPRANGMETMSNKNKTKRAEALRRIIAAGIVIDIVEVAAIAYGIIARNWMPLACAIPLIAVAIIPMVREYHQAVRYVCPHCETVFQPEMKEFFFANHTPKTRKVTCPNCHTKSWCAERSVDEA